jgi:hypothetical protein
MEKFEENNLEKAKAKEDDLKIGYTICLACALYEGCGEEGCWGRLEVKECEYFQP